MDATDIIRFLGTKHYSPADLEEVKDLCRNYPMFNIAHMLKVRIKEVLGYDKEEDLKVAAVYSSDRRKLYKLVNEVIQPPFPDPGNEEFPDEPGGIQFSDEPQHQADVIIEHHAPYAASAPDEDLLELDDESDGEAFTLDENSEARSKEDPKPEVPIPDNLEPPGEKELTSETLIEAVVKGETDLEEPGPERMDIPVIDEIERKSAISANTSLIHNFITEEPGPIRADKKTSLKGDASLSSIREHDGFITDTLAQIYVKQGLYAKAIYAYEKLSLKYPEKSAYFAAQIEKIRNINHS